MEERHVIVIRIQIALLFFNFKSVYPVTLSRGLPKRHCCVVYMHIKFDKPANELNHFKICKQPITISAITPVVANKFTFLKCSAHDEVDQIGWMSKEQLLYISDARLPQSDQVDCATLR